MSVGGLTVVRVCAYNVGAPSEGPTGKGLAMLKELVGRSEVLGREYVAGWARVESGRCDSCDEFGPRARRDGDALCQECIGADYDMAGPSEIAEALGCMLFGGRALAWPRMRPLADAYRRAVGVALDDLFAPVVTIDDVVTVKCSHVLGTTWNGFAVPVFDADRLAVALAECERVGWVRLAPSTARRHEFAQWVDTEHGEPVVTDLGNGEFILGEGWCWTDVADDVAPCDLCGQSLALCPCRRCSECERLQLETAPADVNGRCTGCVQPVRDCLCDDDVCRKCGGELL